MGAWVKSIMAGMAIGLGCWIYLSIENPVIGAILFSCGLLYVRILNLNLYTGKVQFIPKKGYDIIDYLLFLLGNLCGIIIIVAFDTVTPGEKIRAIALLKTQQSFVDALLKGIGCGMLMTIATTKETPLFVSIMCVTAFILAGFNHCIADAYYMLGGKLISINWVATLIGNTIGGIALSKFSYSSET